MAANSHQTLNITVPADLNPSRQWEWLLSKFQFWAEKRHYGRIEVVFEAGKIMHVHSHISEKPP